MESDPEGGNKGDAGPAIDGVSTTLAPTPLRVVPCLWRSTARPEPLKSVDPIPSCWHGLCVTIWLCSYLPLASRRCALIVPLQVEDSKGGAALQPDSPSRFRPPRRVLKEDQLRLAPNIAEADLRLFTQTHSV